MDQSKRPPTFKERWAASRPTKTVVFWSWLGIGILTMIVGFTWGGWVTGSTARAMAEARGEDAVAKRLAPMCALRFENAADKGQKLQELKDAGAWDRAEYVMKQGWATLPGDKEPERKVADECAKLLVADAK
ncbi:MAG TPA: hypothetical protein VL948_05565 [Verrucomicrobiae bacterium]|jgi:hypothetical protein|nr:hypothetical protein [Verrucomicrobiae bacterium]